MAKIPFRVSPMLATLVDAPFTRENWIFEEKYDGVRMLAYKEGDRVWLISRNGINRSERYPQIRADIRKLNAETLLLDGEVVVFDSKRISRFQLLQQGKGKAEYAIFDCLYHNGKDLRPEPLARRSEILDSVSPITGTLLRSARLGTDGLKAFRIASRRGFEGIIGKNLESPYQSRRSTDWLKVKVHREQEFVIGGFTKPKGSRTNFGALLLGVYKEKGLQYAGKVGTGFNDETLSSLRRKFTPLIQHRSPFVEATGERDATYLKPRLVAQIAFTEWTEDDKLRHPVFLGLRDDKNAAEVRREG